MTAEEYLQDSLKISHFYNDRYDMMCCFSDDVQLAIQEYAKLKCQELLKIVVDKAKVKNTLYYSGRDNIDIAFDFYSELDGRFEVDKDSILNSVNLDDFIN